MKKKNPKLPRTPADAAGSLVKGRKKLGPKPKRCKVSKEKNVNPDWTLATSLEFDRKKDVQAIGAELPVFPNLTSVVLGEGYVEWEWLSQFLEKSPCLESLVFKEGYQRTHETYDYDCYYEGDSDGNDKHLLCPPPQSVPSCLRLNLKVINFVNFEGCDWEIKMVEYFLKNAEVLEKLTLQTDGTVDECFDMGGAGCAVAEDKLEVTTKLLMMPRCSKTCQIEFVIRRYNYDGSPIKWAY